MFHHRRKPTGRARPVMWRNQATRRPWFVTRGVVAVVAGLPGVAVVAVPGFIGHSSAFASTSVADVVVVAQVGDEDDKSNAVKSEDGKSEDGKSEEGKSHDGKPQDGKSQDGKSQDGKSQDGKSQDGKAKDEPKKQDDRRERDGRSEDAPTNGTEEGPRQTAEGLAVGCDPNELIAAILRVNGDGGGALKLAKDCTYTLTASQDDTGLPTVTVPLVVVGNNATITRAANASAFRFFNVGAGGDLRLVDLTLTGGSAPTALGGGAVLIQTGGAASFINVTLKYNETTTLGGAIRNQGSLKISRSRLLYNSATGTGSGGAVSSSDGVVSIEDSKFERNIAGDWGGAITSGDATLTVKDSSFENNEAGDGGGAIVANRLTTISHSKFLDNSTTGLGGALNLGVFDNGPFTIRDSIIEGNSADIGGGVVARGTTVIESTKITKNLAQTRAGGILAFDSLVLRRSEITGNRSLGTTGGLSAEGGSNVRLIDTEVRDNTATSGSGGTDRSLTAALVLDEDSFIIANRPTNCLGSQGVVTGCFG